MEWVHGYELLCPHTRTQPSAYVQVPVCYNSERNGKDSLWERDRECCEGPLWIPACIGGCRDGSGVCAGPCSDGGYCAADCDTKIVQVCMLYTSCKFAAPLIVLQKCVYALCRCALCALQMCALCRYALCALQVCALCRCALCKCALCRCVLCRCVCFIRHATLLRCLVCV